MNRLDATYLEVLYKIREDELTIAHVEGHSMRLDFINLVIKCFGTDEKFNKLIVDQLTLFCSRPSSIAFVSICDHPLHRVRNKLITWYIDHHLPSAEGREGGCK